jgi:DNA-binding protein YbaB
MRVDNSLAVLTRADSSFGINFLNQLALKGVKPKLLCVEYTPFSKRLKQAEFLAEKKIDGSILNDKELFDQLKYTIIDMYLVSEPDEVDTNLSEFLSGLYLKFSEYQCESVNNNGLITVSFNGTNIIDITIYNEFFEDTDDESSMFLYAIKNIGLNNHAEYFDKLDQIKFELMIKSSELIEQKTFTSLNFERFATIKGIQNQEKYLSFIPKWKKMGLYFYDQSQKLTLSEEVKQYNYKKFQRYMYQVSPEYISKLENKLQRYKQKIEIINKLLG